MEGDNSSPFRMVDINYTIRNDKPIEIIDTNTTTDISLYEKWEQSNQIIMLFIKTKIDDEFVTSR